MKGVIKENGSVQGEDGKEYSLPWRGTDEEGYPEVLVDAKEIGGRGAFQRQSVKPMIGMTVEFEAIGDGYNYIIIK